MSWQRPQNSNFRQLTMTEHNQNERSLDYSNSDDMTDCESFDDLWSSLSDTVEVVYDDATCDSLINSLNQVSVNKANFKSCDQAQITEPSEAGPSDNSTPASASPATSDQSTFADSSSSVYRHNNNHHNNNKNRWNRRPANKTYPGYRQRFNSNYNNQRPNLPYFRREIVANNGFKRPVHERLGYPYNNNQEEFFNNLRKGFEIFLNVLKLLCQGDERFQLTAFNN